MAQPFLEIAYLRNLNWDSDRLARPGYQRLCFDANRIIGNCYVTAPALTGAFGSTPEFRFLLGV
jgi:hypothetical protein